MQKLTKHITSNTTTTGLLILRSVVFLTGFIVVSGVLGPRIINHDLVRRDGFQVYGGAGKALLFGVLVALLLISKKSIPPTLRPWQRVYICWLTAALAALYSAWFAVGKLIAGTSGPAWPTVAHISLLAAVVFVALGTFGPANIRVLAKAYRRELFIAFALTAAFLAYLYAVYGLWRMLATVVLHAVGWLLGVSGLQAAVLPNYVLMLSKFTIAVSKYCSGIDSIALFSGLYAVVGLVDWSRLNQRKFLIAFVPALLLLFCCNISRVYLLIMAGYYINPNIAFSLFHTYAGMVLFIIYSALFWSLSYRWMLSSDKESR